MALFNVGQSRVFSSFRHQSYRNVSAFSDSLEDFGDERISAGEDTDNYRHVRSRSLLALLALAGRSDFYYVQVRRSLPPRHGNVR